MGRLSAALILTNALAGTTVCAAALSVSHSQLFDLEPHVGIHGIIALIAGAAMACTVWPFCQRHERERERVINHVRQLARETRSADASNRAPARLTSDWRPILEAAHHAIDALVSKLETTAARRRELEVQFRASDSERRHIESILHAISDAVIVTDAFNEVVLANQAAADVLGFHLADARYCPVDEILQDARLAKLIKDTRESGDAALCRRLEHEIRGVRREGEPAVYEVALRCVDGARHDPTDVVGVIMILRDITREKQIAAMKSDFVSAVSHELRTPLSSIRAYMEMLLDGEADDEQSRSEFYNIIQGETNRLTRLIDNILNISRIESGMTRAHRQHLILQRVVKDALDVIQPQARAKQIEIEDRSDSTPIEIFADRDMLHQALLNLLGNAVKYTPEQGRVTVEAARDGVRHEARVTVVDTGVGIPETDLPRLFEKFYRVEANARIARGTGLGLNLVKHIVETVHAGRVSVDSEVGRGSAFTFALPLTEQAAAA